MELKICKNDFIAYLGTSEFKKRWNFYEFGGVRNVMELFLLYSKFDIFS